MAETKGGLQSDPLFLGLTRPAMILGVHYLMFLMNLIFQMLMFINKVYEHQFMVFPSAIGIHCLLYLICLREPRMIELLIARYGKCSKCKNRLYHRHTNSYDLN